MSPESNDIMRDVLTYFLYEDHGPMRMSDWQNAIDGTDLPAIEAHDPSANRKAAKTLYHLYNKYKADLERARSALMKKTLSEI